MSLVFSWQRFSATGDEKNQRTVYKAAGCKQSLFEFIIIFNECSVGVPHVFVMCDAAQCLQNRQLVHVHFLTRLCDTAKKCMVMLMLYRKQ